MDSFLQFLGRLHPVAVHLPIGIFVLLALVELATWFPRGPRLAPAVRTLIVALGFGFALATAGFGWLLARDGGYDARWLERHQTFGIAVAALAAALLIAHLRGWGGLYRGLLAATVLAVAAAGHLGGTLTHGENYLTSSATMTKRVVPIDAAKALVFADVVHPILEQRCVSCHGPAKSNGDLRFDTFEQLRKGGKTGPAFKAGNASASLMLERVHLPLDAKQHMPPKGKPQLTDEEIALIEWWIDAGAPTDRNVAGTNPPMVIAELIATRLGVPPAPPPDRATMVAAAATLERALGIVIRPLTADGPWLEANARLRFANFGDAQLAELAPIAPALHRLDLGETAVTDAGLTALAPMKNLRRLHLDRTAVTDAGLARLSGLVCLESLNLYATKVGDAGLAALRVLPRLRSLHVWQTQITPAAITAFAAKQVDRRKIARWKGEIAMLEAKIHAEDFSVNFGAPVLSVPAPAAPVALAMPVTKSAPPAAAPGKVDEPAAAPGRPVNAACPVTGKPVDARVTEFVAGKLIGFCSADCCGKFRTEPERYPLRVD
jgi:uncharacterized membrane protein